MIVTQHRVVARASAAKFTSRFDQNLDRNSSDSKSQNYYSQKDFSEIHGANLSPSNEEWDTIRLFGVKIICKFRRH